MKLNIEWVNKEFVRFGLKGPQELQKIKHNDRVWYCDVHMSWWKLYWLLSIQSGVKLSHTFSSEEFFTWKWPHLDNIFTPYLRVMCKWAQTSMRMHRCYTCAYRCKKMTPHICIAIMNWVFCILCLIPLDWYFCWCTKAAIQYPQLSYIDIWMFLCPCLLFSSYSHQIVYCTVINNWGYPFMLCTWYYFLIAIPCFTVFKKENPFYMCGVIPLKCSHPKLLAGCWPKLLAFVFCFDVLLQAWSFVTFFLICH